MSGEGSYQYGGSNATRMNTSMGASGIKNIKRAQRKYDKKKKKVIARRRAPYNKKIFGE
jgi:hypothetical protein